MRYQTQKIDAEGLERLAQLNIKIDYRKPNSSEWTIDSDTGDFLIWIYPDREPPHWITFCFYWNQTVFSLKVAMTGDFLAGFSYRVMRVRKERQSWDLLGEESIRFCDALMAAMLAYCRSDVQDLCARRQGAISLASNMDIQTSVADLSKSPVVVIDVRLQG